MSSFILEVLIIFLSWYLGYIMSRSRVKDIDETVYQELRKKDRDTWIAFLDGLKPKTKEDKIKELQEQIKELEAE